MRRLWNRVLLTLAVIGCAGVMSSTAALAQKGKPKPPPPPAPPGIIYFDYDDSLLAQPDLWPWLPWGVVPRQWTINPDGSNMRQLAYDEYVYNPSRQVYGNGYRWSLYWGETGETYDRYLQGIGENRVIKYDHPQIEMFAFRPDGNGGFQVLQLTDLFGDVNRGGGRAQDIEWSNDGLDSFISYVGDDYSDTFSVDPDDGTTEIDILDVRKCIVRLHISGADLDAAADAGTWVPIGPSEREIVMASEKREGRRLIVSSSFYHSWSPDGTKVAYFHGSHVDATGADLWVTDLTTGTTTLLWDVDTSVSPNVIQFPQWQPEGNQILAGYDDNSTGVTEPIIVNADGSGGGPTPTGLDYTWSPDGSQTLYRDKDTVKIRGVNYTRWNLYRFDYQALNEVKVTNDLEKVIWYPTLYWLPTTHAP